MRTFFVFIKCKLGRAYDVAAAVVENVDPCPSIFSISGEYDLIAHFSVESSLDIGRFINETLHEVPDIVDTKTIIAFNTFSKDGGFQGDEKP